MKVKTLKKVIALQQMFREVCDKLELSNYSKEEYYTGNRYTGEIRHLCVLLRNALSDLKKGK